MTDKEIIKALKCCGGKYDCKSCVLWKTSGAECIKKLLENALRLIKRQNEEIEKFKSESHTGKWLINCDGYYPYCSECRYEPIKGKMTNFCPECGAEMRHEAADD